MLSWGSPAGPQAHADPADTTDPADTPDPVAPPSVHPVLGVIVAPESRNVAYSRKDYSYPSSIERRIIARQGGHFSPYSLRCYGDLRDTDIEHIVATSEAHDSGLGTRSDEVKERFAQDLDNLTTAAPRLNRFEKVAKDPAEWLPKYNRCWYVGVWVSVKRKYVLTMDQAEVNAILPMYERFASFNLVIPGCASGS